MDPLAKSVAAPVMHCHFANIQAMNRPRFSLRKADTKSVNGVDRCVGQAKWLGCAAGCQQGDIGTGVEINFGNAEDSFVARLNIRFVATRYHMPRG